MSHLQVAVVQTLLLSLLQSFRDSRNEFVLEERAAASVPLPAATKKILPTEI